MINAKNCCKTAVLTLIAFLSLFALLLSACSTAPGSVSAALEQNKVKDSGFFYDITEKVTEAAPGETIYGCALRDKETLLILSENGKSVFTARLLNLRTGSLSDLCTFANSSQDNAFLEILSVDPLIAYDETNRIIYQPENSKETPDIVIPDALSGAEPVIANGKVYLSTTKGILYKAQDNGSLEEFWRLPYQCSWMTPQTQQDGVHLLFSTYPENHPDQSVYANLDPRTMELTYFSSSTDDIYYTALSDGRYSTLTVDRDPALQVWDPEENSVFSFPIPDEIVKMTENTGSFFEDSSANILLACTNPVAGNLFAFTLSDSDRKPVHVYLCDISGKNASEIREWHTPTKGIYTFPSHSYGELTDKASELYEKYGVTVVLGKNVPSSFPDYTVDPEETELAISNGLSLLEDALSLYPEGYFQTLRDLHYREIVIYLTGKMEPLYPDTNIADAGAFTTDQNGVARVALNLDSGLYRGIIIHEFTHVTDYALIDEGLLPEEGWAKFNPPDFEYYNSYMDRAGNSYSESGNTEYTADGEEDSHNIYFYDTYSKTFAVEDRARLMEVLLRDSNAASGDDAEISIDPCFESSHLKAKINWYSSLLRKTLGSEKWPSETAWESAIKSSGEAQ